MKDFKYDNYGNFLYEQYQEAAAGSTKVNLPHVGDISYKLTDEDLKRMLNDKDEGLLSAARETLEANKSRFQYKDTIITITLKDDTAKLAVKEFEESSESYKDLAPELRIAVNADDEEKIAEIIFKIGLGSSSDRKRFRQYYEELYDRSVGKDLEKAVGDTINFNLLAQFLQDDKVVEKIDKDKLEEDYARVLDQLRGADEDEDEVNLILAGAKIGGESKGQYLLSRRSVKWWKGFIEYVEDTGSNGSGKHNYKDLKSLLKDAYWGTSEDIVIKLIDYIESL